MLSLADATYLEAYFPMDNIIMATLRNTYLMMVEESNFPGLEQGDLGERLCTPHINHN